MDFINKITYYDVLLKTNRELIELINKDIDGLNADNRKGPFSSVDDFSKYFEAYLLERLKRIEQSTKDYLRNTYRTSAKLIDIEFEKAKLTSAYRDRMNEAAYSFHADYITVTNFILWGRKTFFFDNNLVEHLALTELNTKSKYINLPFDSCLFVFNSDLMIKSFYQIMKKNTDIDYKTPLSIFLTSLPSDEGLRTIVFSCYHANEQHNYSYIKRQLLVREDWSIVDMLKTNWIDLYDYSEEEIKTGNYNDETVFFNEGMLFFRTLLNCILYLASNDPDIIKILANQKEVTKDEYEKLGKKDIEVLKKNKHYRTSLDHSLVGSNIGNILIEKSQENDAKQDKKVKRNILRYLKFAVRGHWRNQPYGEGSKERKLIWIKPYIKGKDLAEMLEKEYKVK